MQHKVSVIMTTYNVGEFLKETLESVNKQTYTCHEVIIVDDGSTDETLEILKLYENRNNYHISYFKHTGQIAKNLNYCIKNSTGDLIAVLGADDIWMPHKLEEQIKFIDRYRIISTNSYLIDETGCLTGKYNLIKPGINFEMNLTKLLEFNLVISSSVLAEKSLLIQAGMFDEDTMNRAEDYSLWLRCAEITNFLYLNKPLVKYRFHKRNLSFISYENRAALIKTTIRLKLRYLSFNDEIIRKSVLRGLIPMYWELTKLNYRHKKLTFSRIYLGKTLNTCYRIYNFNILKYVLMCIILKFKSFLKNG